MYFSERRKQGLGSLRPGYDIGGFLTGNLLNWGLNKGINYLTKSPEQREKEEWEKTKNKLGIIDYVDQSTNEKEDDDTTKSSGWKGGWKGKVGGGIMNLLATALFGPLMGPIALTIGRGIMNKNKGLGFTGGSGGSGPGPKPPGPQKDWYTGSDEEDKDIENQITKNFSGIDSGGWDPGVASTNFSGIDSGGWDPGVASTTANEGPSNIGPTGHDIHGGPTGQEGSPEHGGQDQGATTSDAGWADDGYWAEGGRVSYSKGGIASLWQR